MHSRAFVVVALLLTAPVSAQLRFSWTDLGLQLAQSPPPRSGHRMVYDEARGVTLLFGGRGTTSSSYLNDTWTFDGRAWTRMSPAHQPLARWFPAMAYDPVRERVVMAGGRDAATFDDTWEWDGADWTLVDSSTAGIGWDACYDPVLRGVFCSNGTGQFLWDGGHWIQLGVSSSSTAGNAMVFDAASGGELSWSSNVTSVFRPQIGRNAVFYHNGFHSASNSAGAYSTRRQIPVLFGGVSITSGPPQTWWWNGRGWQMATLVEPPRRSASAMAYDVRRDVFVMFGGDRYSGSEAADTWELSITANPASFATYGQGCAGSTGTAPTLDADARWSTAPIVGGLFFARIDGAPISQPVFGIVGLSRTLWGNFTLPFDLTPLGMPGCALLASMDVVEAPGIVGPTAGLGRSAIGSGLPPRDRRQLAPRTWRPPLSLQPSGAVAYDRSPSPS